jgi:acetyl-CoA carboxylase biotin carboxylase subunit
MISKLAAWGRARTEAIDRMRRALDEYAVGGIKTTLPVLREIVRDEEFIAGYLDTGFIPRFNERSGKRSGATQASSLHQDLAIITAAIAYAESQRQASNNHRPEKQSKWKISGRNGTLNRIPPGRAPQFNE